MKFTFRDIVWIGIIALILVVLSKCHRDDSSVVNDRYKALQEKHILDSIEYSKSIHIQESQINETIKKADSIGRVNQALEVKLDDKATTVIRLAALQKAKLPGIDNKLISVGQVGQDYIVFCDSLAFKASGLAAEYLIYKQNNTALLASKDEIISGKDGIITTERKAKEQVTNNYNALARIYQEYQLANKPRNQMYIGVELISNPTYLVNNVGIAISLKTKSNKLWQISGGLQTNGQYYARINGNILIKFKP